MNSKSAKNKSEGNIVFITVNNISRWMPDAGHPESSDKFLDDCRRQGWPIFKHPSGTAYVYACDEVAS
jgi:hypothetical protein